jgi:tRNA threonylcarbamoyladenosine biosynthesis protein TsaB
MIGLGIDTSTTVGSLALVRDDRLLIEDTIDAELNHSATLLPVLQSALKKTGLSRADLDCIGVGVGPGSLTGVRVGIAFAKGVVFALRKPLVGVSSFEAIAWRRRDFNGLISVIVDARMGGFYCAGYRWEGENVEEIDPLSLYDKKSLAKHLKPPSLVLSSDAQLPADLVSRIPPGCEIEPVPVFPSAEHVARQAILHAGQGMPGEARRVEPVYLRPGVPGKMRLQ